MDRISEITGLIDRLEYFIYGGYTTYDTLRSLCQDAASELGRLSAELNSQTDRGGFWRTVAAEWQEKALALDSEAERHKDFLVATAARETVLSEKVNKLLSDNDRITAELERYKALEREGRLIELPCKVGDTVYNIILSRNIISTLTIESVEIYKQGQLLTWKLIDGIYDNIRGFTEFELGKTVFLTREEAEQAARDALGVE